MANPGHTPPKPPPSERRAAVRAKAIIPVRVRYESVLDFVETQSMNISSTGMFIVTEAPTPMGTVIEFEFSLADGFVLLKGLAEVVRVVTGGIVEGMGVRFVDLDPENQRIINRIVAVNSDEGREPTLRFDFSRPATAQHMPVVEELLSTELLEEEQEVETPPAPRPLLQFNGLAFRLVLAPETAHHFTSNPLANVRTGGLMVPGEKDVPLGTMFEVTIVDQADNVILAGKGKVLTKHELRLGLRLVDVPKDSLTRLQAAVAEVAKTKPSK
jgi:uncharacterized protein (TIGR02266 family)